MTEDDLKKCSAKKRRTKNTPSFNLQENLMRITDVDLTAVPGVEAHSGLKIISEIGLT